MPVYIDPSRGTNGAGTFADPRNTWAGVTWTAGETYLQRAGTTFAGRITVGASGTANSRIVVGVYDPATGNEITNQLGAAIVQANGDGTGPAINAAQDFVTIRCLEARNAGGTATLIRNGSNDGAIVEYCRANGGGGNGITFFQQSGAVGIVARNSEACGNGTGNNGYGITLEGTPDAGWVVNITGNVLDRNRGGALWLIPYDEARDLAAGTIADNLCRDNLNYGIRVTCNVQRGVVVSGNTCTGNTFGITVDPNPAGTLRSRVLVVRNRCNNNRQFGIHVVRAQGWTLRSNECSRNGEDSSPRYGRGIELVGAAFLLCSGLVEDNDCHENRNFGGTDDNGTEGVGIGVDDFCGDVNVRSNRCFQNEGCGIQCNHNGAGGTVNVESNLLIDNWRVDAARFDRPTWQATAHNMAQIGTGNTQNNLRIRGNTIVNTGVVTCPYGIREHQDAPGTDTDIRNNVIVGHAIAGMKVRNAITRTHNAFWRNGVNVQSQQDVGFSTLSNGTGAVTADPLLTAGGAPMPGSPLLRAGTSTGRSRDLRGVLRHPTTPTLGAFEFARFRSI